MAYFPGVGAFEQLFGSEKGEFERLIFQKSNARGVARVGGGGDVEWYICFKTERLLAIKNTMIKTGRSMAENINARPHDGRRALFAR